MVASAVSYKAVKSPENTLQVRPQFSISRI